MAYLTFIAFGVVGAALGYAFGFGLDRWESASQPGSRDDFVGLMIVVGASLSFLAGSSFLLFELRILSLLAAGLLSLVGFRMAHPKAPERIRQLARTLSQIVRIVRN